MSFLAVAMVALGRQADGPPPSLCRGQVLVAQSSRAIGACR